ncbi:MAG: AAA family ATPase [Candidatus Dojkabacteria bacterium]
MSSQSTINQAVSEQELSKVTDIINRIASQYHSNIIGQDHLLQSMLVTLLAGGNMLLEGVPGLAKTRAVKTLSSMMNASFKRIQFTPDLLPSDVVGNQVFNPKTSEFTVRKGPIFANIVLADEINRAPGKVQSALLESMQEKQVTIGGETFTLPRPFMVLATQNPIEQEGTYTLPEAQVDRFLIKHIVSYPSYEEEMSILNLIEGSQEISTKNVVNLEEILSLQELVDKVYIDASLKHYITSLVFATRNPGSHGLTDLGQVISFGASPRATLAFMKGAKAVALLNGRHYVIPEDIKSLRYEILRHRIVLSYEAQADGVQNEQVIERIFQTIQVP